MHSSDPSDSRLSDPWLWLILGVVIVVLFGGYEILERTYVDPYYPGWKYYLHIIRGVLTALLAAGVVGLYLVSNPPFTRHETGELEFTGSKTGRDLERTQPRNQLIARMNSWFVRMRWIVCGTALFFLFFDYVSLRVLETYQFKIILVLFAGLTLLNFVLYSILNRSVDGRFLSVFQLGLDLLALSVLVHVTGGVESPFLLLYTFPVVISGILYQSEYCYGTVLTSSFFFVVMLVLEGIGLLGHHPIWEEARITIAGRNELIYQEPGILITAMGFLTGFLLVVAYLITAARNRLRDQRRALRERMIYAGKMNVLRDLAGGIAHDMGNSINCLKTRLQLLEREDRLGPEELEDHVEVLQRHTNQLNHHVRLFSRIARSNSPEYGSERGGDVNQAIRDAVDLLLYETDEEEVDIKTDLSSDISTVALSRDALELIFLNLGRNGVEAMSNGGILSFQSYSNGEQICVDVSDDGEGISEEIREHMFEPFYTSKQAGIGLGLFLVRQSVETCDGDISFETNPGEGTTFTICFPVIH